MRHEVIICGDGLFALLCAIELQKSGVQTLRLHGSVNGFDKGSLGMGILWSTLPDPPTRAEVAHGHEVAVYLNEFLEKARELAKNKLVKLGFQKQLMTLATRRLALEPHEQRELHYAAQSFQHLKKVGSVEQGLAEIYSEPDSLYLNGFDSLAELLLNEEKPESRMQKTVSEIKESGDNVSVICDDGSAFDAELVVLGLGASTGKVMSRYQSVVVPVTDVLTHIEIERSSNSKRGPDTCLRASSGHLSALLRFEQNSLKIAVSGPKYALKSAGVGWSVGDQEKVQDDDQAAFRSVGKHLQLLLPKILGGLESDRGCHFGFDAAPQGSDLMSRARITAQRFRTDCLPCDELPLLGEFGTQGRILGNAGWLGCGHSAAFLASKIICDLILRGHSSELHPLLAPKRLQTL